MEKIKIKSVIFTFSESNQVKCGIEFSLDSANHHLANVAKPSLGYYKTDFTITFEDGEEYKGRYDIGSDYPTLSDHVINFCQIYGGIKKPSRMTDSQWEKFKKVYGKHLPYYAGVLTKYDLMAQ